MEEIKISVRNLVEFILRSGDIDDRGGLAAQKEAMQEGSRLHRKIQGGMGASYRPEVPLKAEVDRGRYALVVEGRADGVITEGENVTVDEIKCVRRDVSKMEGPIPVHEAQAKCYAYILAAQGGLPEVSVQMTYCNLDTEEIRRFRREYPFGELDGWFQDLVASYGKWADFQYEAKIARDASIRRLEFPFPYREGQKKLAGDVYRTIKRGKILFIQAPTGSGKTITTVFPAVKAVGEGLADKIFYLTAKTVTQTVAGEAFGLLRGRGYQGSVITITAKEKICLRGLGGRESQGSQGEAGERPAPDCNPDSCPYAKGHFDRVNDAIFAMITEERDITRETVWRYAREHRVCPYEMCLDASMWADDIICDYNYVFDPNAALRRFFGEGAKGDYIFLIDEAHNLVERGREMYSAMLCREDFWKFRETLRPHSKKCAAALGRCARQFPDCGEGEGEYRQLDGIGNLAFSLMRLGSAFEEFFQEGTPLPEGKEVLEFYFGLRHFLNMHDRAGEDYVIYAERERGRLMLRLFCVNPAASLQECLDKGRSAIFFSATLLPIRYYKKLLSAREDNYAVYAQTVFSPKQRLLAIGRDVSSRYSRRTEGEFTRIAGYIHEAAAAKRGNYLAFFPSYKMMRQVAEKFLGTEGVLEEMDIKIQENHMTEREKEEFLAAFSKKREKSLVGFCVMGGIFAEGVDLRKDALIGAIIVGTGLPQVCTERAILKEYYDKSEGAGFDYAFRYPGMNKVLQAAGRVIRTAEDKGVILLLDDRFLQKEYRSIFPREWETCETTTLSQVRTLMEAFWEGG